MPSTSEVIRNRSLQSYLVDDCRLFYIQKLREMSRGQRVLMMAIAEDDGSAVGVILEREEHEVS